MDKTVVMGLLRGGFCQNCRYLISTGREWDTLANMVQMKDLNPPHCALKTDMNGKSTEKSKIENPCLHSCRSYWAPEPRHNSQWDR